MEGYSLIVAKCTSLTQGDLGGTTFQMAQFLVFFVVLLPRVGGGGKGQARWRSGRNPPTTVSKTTRKTAELASQSDST